MFIVIEIQVEDSTVSTIVNSYQDINQAEYKYHTILSVAAVSNVDIHSAAMLTEDGTCLKSESYNHKDNQEE